MPRRSRIQPHTLRKRGEPPGPPKARPHPHRIAEPDAPAEASEPVAVPVVPGPEAVAAVSSTPAPVTTATVARPYIARQPRAMAVRAAAAPVAASPTKPATPRAERLATTDYTYVVGEMKRILLTGGGIVVLLLILSRFIH